MLARVVGECGAVRYRHAHTALTNTKVAVLLVTPDFIGRDTFLWNIGLISSFAWRNHPNHVCRDSPRSLSDQSRCCLCSAQRVAPPVIVGGAEMRWNRPACSLGSAQPSWG